ncbi:MAG TPA: hypothetical protein VFO85_06535, partial [Vicinamibacteria bacterium]|nr:hypothetical protein [Vicinamibacteria bacterium]
LACAVLTLFGLMHSVLPTGSIYLPWSPALQGTKVPYHWAAAYAAFAVMILAFARTAAREEQEPVSREAA